MDENRFFKWVWRLNSLIILLLVIFFALTYISQILRMIEFRRAEEEIITNVAEDPEGKEKWVLGYPTEIKGCDYILLPLESENKEIESSLTYNVSAPYSGSRSYNAKNILFINASLNESHWLYNNTGQLILSTDELPQQYRNISDNIKTLVIIYEVIKSDSNQDGILNSEDKPSLALSGPNGKGYHIILDEFDRIISKSLVGDDKILIVYQKEGVGYSALFQLDPFEIILKKEIPKIENS